MKNALALSPVLPIAVTVYGPLVTEPTMKDPATTPLDTEHETGDETRSDGVEEIVQLVSDGLKFELETVTVLPRGPAIGVKVTMASFIFATSLPANNAKPVPYVKLSLAVDGPG